MNEAPTVVQFEDDLHAVITRYRAANLLTLAEAVGTLHILAAELIRAEVGDEPDEYA